MIPPRRIALVFLGLFLFGIAKLPVEISLTRQYRAAHFMQAQLNRDVRAQTSQMGFIAALSGMRAAVADVMWLQAHQAWTKTEWGRMNSFLNAATSLQPRNLNFWNMAAWHMAWNANVAALQNTKQPREALRMRAAYEYAKLGEDYLLRGISFNWDHAQLYENLGMLYDQKLKDHERAAWAYFEAAKRPDAKQYVYRNGIYQLALCPGHEQETLKLALEDYRLGPQERTPHLLHIIQDFQVELNVPESQRIDVTKDLEEGTPRSGPVPAKQ